MWRFNWLFEARFKTEDGEAYKVAIAARDIEHALAQAVAHLKGDGMKPGVVMSIKDMGVELLNEVA